MQPRKSPYRSGGHYRPTRSFISTVDTFRMGEVLAFVGQSRPEGRDVTSYVFADATGACSSVRSRSAGGPGRDEEEYTL